MIIYVLDDGETWTLSEPTAVAITDEQLTRIEGGEKVYSVVPNWSESPEPDWDEQQDDDADDFFIQAGIAAREALKEIKRDYTKSIVDAQNKGGE
tara:strand:+ start:1116 stop:1400 length:285 start_codon:yes stop_codon:yes gene_type:complete